MTRSLKFALLLGAVAFVSAAGFAPAQMSNNNGGPLQGIDRFSERGAERLVREFDVNRDGRVTHDEMNRTIGARFAAATHRAPKMSGDVFMAVRTDSFRKSNEAAFRRLDWSGDGKLTLAEYGMAQRLRFASLDREGAGVVSCIVVDGRGGGVARFCTDNDLNLDGRVTRAELDSAIAKRFAQVTGGAQTMSEPQFALSEQQRFAPANARLFRRLDEDGDGYLTVQEFGGNELKLFAKLDTNHDGVLGPAELHVRSARNGSRFASN